MCADDAGQSESSAYAAKESQDGVFATVWVLLSVFVNVSVTSLICLRIIRTRSQLESLNVLESRHLAKYTGVMAILIESALPFSVCGVVAAPFFINANVMMVYAAPAVMTLWFCLSVRLPSHPLSPNTETDDSH